MQIHLVSGKCAGHALCHGVDEYLFPIDDEGYSTVEDRELGPDEVDAAREGVAVCPEGALQIVESGKPLLTP
jgi:ferredoxin